MKRSSSKVIAKAGSMRNINKQGYKFHCSLTIESVNKILSASEVIFSWERNNKILSSKPTRVDKDSRTATFQNEKLSQDITFFKKKKAGSPFEDKVFRCLLKDANNTSKIVGKIDLNFSQHIDIPSSSKRMSADLNNGSRLVFKFESKFLSEVKKGKKEKEKLKDKDTSSVSSYNTDDLESEFDPKDQDVDLADLADLEDLDINDEPPFSSTNNFNTSSKFETTNYNQNNTSDFNNSNNNNTVKPPLGPSPSYDDSLNSQQPKYTRKVSSNVNSSPAIPVKSSRGRRSRDPSPGRLNESSVPVISQQEISNETSTNAGGMNPLKFRKGSSKHEMNNDQTTNGSLGSNGFSNVANNNNNAALEALKKEMESLRRENRQYKRRNEDLQSRVSDLESRLADASSNQNNQFSSNRRNSDQAAEIDDLYSENRSLKEHIDELEIKIRREPTYADVVRDLREAKMALAIINLEKDELIQQLRKYTR